MHQIPGTDEEAILQSELDQEPILPSRGDRGTIRRRLWAAISVVVIVALVVTGSFMAVGQRRRASNSRADVSEAMNAQEVNPTRVLGVAFSGGGFRSLSTDVGVYKALVEHGLADKVSIYSSNSGGSWFNLLKSYSTDFHQSVMSSTASSEVVTNFIQEYFKRMECTDTLDCAGQGAFAELWNFVGNGGLEGITSKKISGSLEGATGWITSSVAYEGLSSGWENFVTRLLGKTPTGTDVASIPLTQDNRVDSKTSDLLIFTVMDKSVSLSSETKAKLKDAKNNIPIGYYVSASGSGYFCPACPNSDPNQFTVESDDFMGFGSDSGSLDLDSTPNVGLLAAGSSAASGMYVDLMNYPPITDASNLSPCAGGTGTVDPCKSYRFTDGGFTDNTAVAILVGKLQQKHGSTVELGILLANSVHLPAYDYPWLFKGGYREVFDCEVTEEEQTQLKSGDVQTLVKNCKTSSNAQYGVQAGQTVQITILQINNGGIDGVLPSDEETTQIDATNARVAHDNTPSSF